MTSRPRAPWSGLSKWPFAGRLVLLGMGCHVAQLAKGMKRHGVVGLAGYVHSLNPRGRKCAREFRCKARSVEPFLQVELSDRHARESGAELQLAALASLRGPARA